VNEFIKAGAEAVWHILNENDPDGLVSETYARAVFASLDREQVARAIAPHQALEPDAYNVWACECGSVVYEGPQHLAWGAFAAHQADALIAALLEES